MEEDITEHRLSGPAEGSHHTQSAMNFKLKEGTIIHLVETPLPAGRRPTHLFPSYKHEHENGMFIDYALEMPDRKPPIARLSVNNDSQQDFCGKTWASAIDLDIGSDKPVVSPKRIEDEHQTELIPLSSRRTAVASTPQAGRRTPTSVAHPIVIDLTRDTDDETLHQKTESSQGSDLLADHREGDGWRQDFERDQPVQGMTQSVKTKEDMIQPPTMESSPAIEADLRSKRRRLSSIASIVPDSEYVPSSDGATHDTNEDREGTEDDDDDDDDDDETVTEPRSKRRRVKKHDPRTDFDDKAKCIAAAYDDPDFRRWATKDGFTFLRQMKPDLKPWRFEEGIWSTNDPSADGTLFGGCAYQEHKLQRANEDFGDLTVTKNVEIFWDCTRCLRQHKLVIYNRGFLTLLAVGALDKETWVEYLTGQGDLRLKGSYGILAN